MSNWKWDYQHIIIALAFLSGVGWTMGQLISMVGWNPLALAPAIITTLAGIWAFWKNPPNNPVDALKEGLGQPPPPAPPPVGPACLLALFLVCSAPACKGGSFPQAFDNIVQIVLAGVEAGETRDQIEEDVANALGINGPINADVVALVNDAVTILLDWGLIPGNFLLKAQQLQIAERADLAAGHHRYVKDFHHTNGA